MTRCLEKLWADDHLLEYESRSRKLGEFIGKSTNNQRLARHIEAHLEALEHSRS